MFLFKKLIVVALSSVFLYSAAFAAGVGFGVEPYLGYGIAGSFGVPNKPSDSYNGIALGARAVVKFADIFFAGPDILYLPSINYSPADQTEIITQTPNSLKFGVVGGIQLLFPLRLWVGYNFVDNASISDTFGGTTITDQFSGSSWKLGAGYSILPLLSINAEYIAGTYNNLSETIGKVTTSGPLSSDRSPSSKVFLLSVSAPLSLPY
jgi:Outer membrane protein beta-barrel domain